MLGLMCWGGWNADLADEAGFHGFFCGWGFHALRLLDYFFRVKLRTSLLEEGLTALLLRGEGGD